MDKAHRPITMQRGEPFNLVWTFQQSDDDGQTFDPMDLTGYHARMQVRARASEAADLLLTADDVEGSIVLGGTAGTVTFAVTAAAIVDALPAGQYAYDFALRSPSGIVDYALHGPVVVETRVTVFT